MRIVGSAGEIVTRDLDRIVFNDGVRRDGLAGFIKTLLELPSEYCLGVEFTRGKSNSVLFNFSRVIQKLVPQGGGRFTVIGNVLWWDQVFEAGYDEAVGVISRKMR
jgi:hypothetical protein